MKKQPTHPDYIPSERVLLQDYEIPSTAPLKISL